MLHSTYRFLARNQACNPLSVYNPATAGHWKDPTGCFCAEEHSNQISGPNPLKLQTCSYHPSLDLLKHEHVIDLEYRAGLLYLAMMSAFVLVFNF